MRSVEQAMGGPVIEVVAEATRRRFTVEYKRKIVREAGACKTPGAVGALLRREGLYSSHLTTWRAARERGRLAGAPTKRGPVRRVADPRDKRITGLERERTRWQQRAERAEALVELQKQIAALLGTPLTTGWNRRRRWERLHEAQRRLYPNSGRRHYRKLRNSLYKECPFPTHDAERDDDERKPDDRQDDQKWARELESHCLWPSRRRLEPRE